jgi:hypothetical protein
MFDLSDGMVGIDFDDCLDNDGVHAWLSQGRLQRTKVGGRTMIRESELAKVIEHGGKSPSPRRKS